MSSEEELPLGTVSWWLCGDRSDQESESDESLFFFFFGNETLEMNERRLFRVIYGNIFKIYLNYLYFIIIYL